MSESETSYPQGYRRFLLASHGLHRFSLGIGAFVGVPLIRQDKWRFYFSLLDTKPHDWRKAEIELLRELTNRIWIRLERARAEIALRESEARYRMVNQELEAFSHLVSHDLKTPLNYIALMTGRLELRLESTQLTAENRRLLNIILQSALQAGAMVDDLLKFSHIGQVEMQWATVSMNALVQQVQQQLLPDIAGRSIRWQIEPLLDVQGDAALLRLVWQNLLSNALKFTRDRAEAIITLGSRHHAHEVVFFVQDNGVGFDKQYHDCLFTIFQRLHPKEQFTGTGVGLANVRRIIQRHGGRTWAEGVIDQGATIYFSLPKQQQACH